MRGAILSLAILAMGANALVLHAPAQAGSAAIVTTRQLPKTVTPPPKPPPTPAPRPVAVKVAKPDYSKRTMALIQQNIALQAAMRAGQGAAPASRCKASWSQEKLLRKGCLAAPSETSPQPPSGLQIADARLCASAVEGADCGALQAARDRAAREGGRN